MTTFLVPALLLAVSALALARGVDVYDALLEGGRNGLELVKSIFPALVMLLTAVELLRVSGAMEALTRLLTPGARLLGIPPETLPLALVRPLSGSAALAVGADLMTVYGPDSLVGRTAAIMLGSTETTFYTISVYFSAAGIKRSRYALPAALIADLVGFATAALTAKWL
ncbi:MAG: spore maturation protein [Oscillospiraceae bacterium]|nr:spore maturation protein [Oscillospiraceae bacterium]